MEFLEKISKAIEELKGEEAETLVKEAIEKGIDPFKVLNGVTAGARAVGDKFQRSEYFLLELFEGAEITEKCLGLVTPHLPREATTKRVKVVLGSVAGDLHDIGKNLVALLLRSGGFEVYDLGVDVPCKRFIEEAEKVNASIIAISALMYSTRLAQKETIKLLEDLGLRSKYKVMIGGGATTKPFAESVGADGWAENAVEAVNVAKQLVGTEG